ncbi:pirin [Haloprofundus marisrubri]|uniref:Pirin n=1 Tax=Haloprofundus marisrubri TaxID=1514971 RepID=A0A0W1RDN9_9EURY|nr:pirin family protein [Haloprofundus marisrubri]KTG11609.1 pirin [Haloprofundus marisrubri]
MSRNDSERDPTDGPVSGETVRHGTGVNSTRAFPTNGYPSNLDPFVLFERFYIDPDDGFPMHAHRGFEIVSYMLDGGMEHEDSLGVTHTAREGDAMRITTGSGIEHSEFPADGEACNGLQLWVNLPRERKNVDAAYDDAVSTELPTVEHEGTTVTTVVGDGSPLSLQTPMEYLDVEVDDAWTWTGREDWSGFVYGVSGEGTVDGNSFGEGDVLPMTETASVEFETEGTLRVVVVSGLPHDEPIQQRGPFVL